MAENLNVRTARKAAIKRASAAARISLRRIDRRALERLTDLYEAARADIEDNLRAAGDDAGTIRLQRLQDLLAQTTVRLRQLEVARNDLFGAELLEAATAGIEPFRAAASISTTFNRIPEDTVQLLQRFIDTDGLQLSDRLWRIDRGARTAVGHAIERAVILGHGASEAARDFLARGAAVPADIQAKLGAAAANGISKAAGQALMSGEGNAYSQALRVFRTEINRAHNSAYEAAAFEDEEVVGTRFLLSPNHPRSDICDMHANANLHGLGKGVYPQGKTPYPAHPNTLSFIVAVFADEVTEADRQGKEDRITWLKRQSPGMQQAVLGSTKKRAALEQGLLKENQIATPWKVLQPRYIKQGVDVDALIATVAEPIGIVTGRAPTTFIPQGSPVSGAFNAVYHAKVAERVLTAIDGIHGDGRLPVIPIKNSPANTGAYGYYRHIRGGPAVDIHLTAGGKYKDLTLAHEIGHFLDHHGVPGPGFSSVAGAEFENWRRAVDSTPEIRHLRSLLAGPDVIASPNGPVHIKKTHAAYLLTYEETWARSYAQYIAARSGDEVLQGQLRDLRSRTTGGDYSLPHQWQDDHFLPVGIEIDKLMEQLKWIKK